MLLWNEILLRFMNSCDDCGPEAADTDSACVICHCVMCPCTIVCVLESEGVTLTEGSSVL